MANIVDSIGHAAGKKNNRTGVPQNSNAAVMAVTLSIASALTAPFGASCAAPRIQPNNLI